MQWQEVHVINCVKEDVNSDRAACSCCCFTYYSTRKSNLNLIKQAPQSESEKNQTRRLDIKKGKGYQMARRWCLQHSRRDCLWQRSIKGPLTLTGISRRDSDTTQYGSADDGASSPLTGRRWQGGEALRRPGRGLAPLGWNPDDLPGALQHLQDFALMTGSADNARGKGGGGRHSQRLHVGCCVVLFCSITVCQNQNSLYCHWTITYKISIKKMW